MPTNPLIVISLFTGYALILTLGVWAVIEIIVWLLTDGGSDED